MIIIGYQGIGKSTLAGTNKCIDLESGNFWFNDIETGQIIRHRDWYVPYCKIANHLSEQGFTVFVSSHKVVRELLKKSKEPVFVVHPGIELKDEWIAKLRERYEATGLEKDYKALKNAEDRYEENITELMNCGIPNYPIPYMNYKLSDLIDYLKFLIVMSERGD